MGAHVGASMSRATIVIVTPSPAGSLSGNRVTAERYEALLRALGHRVRVVERFTGEAADVLIALHSVRSHASVQAFRAACPNAPIVVVLTGTDVYGDDAADPRGLESLSLASLVVVLQPEAREAVPSSQRSKVRVVLQSIDLPIGGAIVDESSFQVCQLAHLRAVKAPFLLANAVRRLERSSTVRAFVAGEALDAGIAERARLESEENPRWTWLGPLPRALGWRLLAESRALVNTSVAEGGSIAIAEAIVSAKPVLATRIAGSVGMLGSDHPGLFASGDADELSALLARLEADPSFERELTSASRDLAPRYAPERESDAWRNLLSEIL